MSSPYGSKSETLHTANLITAEQANMLASPSVLQLLLRDMPYELATNQVYRSADGKILLHFMRSSASENANTMVTVVDTTAPDLCEEGLDYFWDIPECAGSSGELIPFKSKWGADALRDALLLSEKELLELLTDTAYYNQQHYRLEGCIAVI